jgi:hypothetical protein
MIYDVGMAYGKSKVLSKELLAGILLTAMGQAQDHCWLCMGAKF